MSDSPLGRIVLESCIKAKNEERERCLRWIDTWVKGTPDKPTTFFEIMRGIRSGDEPPKEDDKCSR